MHITTEPVRHIAILTSSHPSKLLVDIVRNQKEKKRAKGRFVFVYMFVCTVIRRKRAAGKVLYSKPADPSNLPPLTQLMVLTDNLISDGSLRRAVDEREAVYVRDTLTPPDLYYHISADLFSPFLFSSSLSLSPFLPQLNESGKVLRASLKQARTEESKEHSVFSPSLPRRHSKFN
jgi:hypothetical protein